MKPLNLKIGLDVIRSYRRLDYKPWYALAEFVDNSTQSYRDNRSVLNRAYAKESTNLRVTISYDRNAGILIVRDNAMGMSFEELQRALHIGKSPAATTGRSQYGLGLKTAACWFGDRWSVRTKKLGDPHGYKVQIDVNEVAVERESHPLVYEKITAPKNAHFTEIRIESLHAKLQGRRLGKTKESLRSMYRVDIRAGELTIVWDNTPLEWLDDLSFLPNADGSSARTPIDFDVAGRKVRGWVDVLAPGSSSRGNAGFALIRRGRLIQGWPNGWRPEAIFGPPPGRNDLINQRITGEIHLDAFDVTHTKDGILWQDDEEDDVQDGIKARIADLLTLARTFRLRRADPSPPPRDRKLALDAVVQDTAFREGALAAGRMIESMIRRLPSDVAIDPIARAVEGEPLLMTIDLGNRNELRVVSTSTFGAESQYLTVRKLNKSSWILVVNAMHPSCPAPEDAEALRGHMQHVLADGLVMWALETERVSCDPALLLTLKDAILRVMSEV